MDAECPNKCLLQEYRKFAGLLEGHHVDPVMGGGVSVGVGAAGIEMIFPANARLDPQGHSGMRSGHGGRPFVPTRKSPSGSGPGH